MFTIHTSMIFVILKVIKLQLSQYLIEYAGSSMGHENATD